MKLSKHIVSLFIAGLFSGLVASFSNYALPKPSFGLYFYAFFLIPGVFGLVVGLYFFIFGKSKSLKNLIIFIFSSSFSFILAYAIAMNILYIIGIPLGAVLGSISGLFIGGMVWAWVILFSFSNLIVHLHSQKIWKLTILGGILAFCLLLIPDKRYLPSYYPAYEGFLLLFPVWQSIMAAGIGWAMDKNSKR